MVTLTIDGRQAIVPEKTTILEAAASIGIRIPTLCYWKELNEIAACRVCLVEVEGYERLFTACNNPVEEGMVVHTHSKKADDARRTNVELILAEHNANCAYCIRSGNCTLQEVANDLNITEIPYEKNICDKQGDPNFPLIRDYSKCIKCMRCVQVCDKIQDTHVWDLINTGSRTTVDVSGALTLDASKCALCGQCITHCPVGALHERDDTGRMLRALNDPDLITVVQIAPSIRAAWGEDFGLDPEFATVERLCAALKLMGFDYVFDTDFSADLTITEEAAEFLERLKKGDLEKYPMFTSCCPGWMRFCKSHYPEFVDQLSTSKSPQQMFGAVAKSYYAEILGVSPEKIFSVSIMPCLAKKAECDYPSINDAGAGQDVDLALTTREINRLIRMKHIMPKALPEEPLDMPLGLGSGAGAIFGATGGVMEAALRTAYYYVTGKNPDPDAFTQVRGLDGWKEAVFDVAGTPVRVAVANGLGNAGKLLEALRRGDVHYDFVEVMACPGGCVGGGGQPIHDRCEMAGERGKVLYNLDAKGTLRFSHENPSIVEIYDKYFGKPLSEKAEQLLHTDQHGWKMPGEA